MLSAMKTAGIVCSLAVLAVSISGVEILCEYGIMEWGVDIDVYTCNATMISVEHQTSVTEIKGTHLTGRNDEDVKAFIIQNHKILTKIPNGIGFFFENLELFQWYLGSISTIDSSTFSTLSNLLLIDLAYNKLLAIGGDLFQHTPKLQQIHFNNNSLDYVGNGLLNSLTNLTYANFLNNSCISSVASGRDRIESLIGLLQTHCQTLTTTADPPTTIISTTSEPNECTIRCTSNKDAHEMKKRIEDLEKRIAKRIANRIANR